MNATKYFSKELNNPETSYFIFDTAGDRHRGDIDFEQYAWQTNRFDKVKEGDLFIYRKPSNVSETNKFYFFGVCKIGNITDVDSAEKRVAATFSKRFPFEEMVRQEDMESYRWEWKDRGETWEHFFNQYGMNIIPKNDFLHILSLAEGEGADIDTNSEIKAIQSMQKGNYTAEDEQATTSVRSKQRVFSNKVKLNYKYQCAVSGINTKALLIGAHIIPWSVRKETRLDPRNGICLSVLYDKLFDKGYITLDENYAIKVSPAINQDPVLAKEILLLEGKEIKLPTRDKPLQEYLAYHRGNIFKQ